MRASRASLLAAAALLACALSLSGAAAQAVALLPAAPAPAPAMEAAAAPAAEDPLVSQYRLSPSQAAALSGMDPAAILADLKAAGITPEPVRPFPAPAPRNTLYDYVMFATVKMGEVAAAEQALASKAAPADPNVRDAATGETPIFAAVEQSGDNPAMLDLLLKYGADTNVVRDDGATPLLLAIAGRLNATVSTLLMSGADANLNSTTGLTPLLAAVVSNQPRVVESLMTAGAAPNQEGAGGELPLVEAAKAKPVDMAVVEALLEAGAVPDLADGSGESAMDVAEMEDNPPLLELLASYSARAAAPAPKSEPAAGPM